MEREHLFTKVNLANTGEDSVFSTCMRLVEWDKNDNITKSNIQNCRQEIAKSYGS